MRIHPRLKECIYIRHHFLLLTWMSYPPDLLVYTFAQFWRPQEKVVACYWIQDWWGGFKKKNIPFPEENKLFACDFVLIWIKQTLIWFNLQRDRTRDGLSSIKETFAETLQLQMSVLHQRMRIFQSSMLVSQVHIMAGQNVKKK